MFSPVSLLLPYQKAMLDLIHKHRLCHFICARQIGKSFIIAYAAIEHCFTTPNAKVVILSSGERASLEVLDKCKKLLKVFKMALSGTPGDLSVEVNASEIRFGNGSKIITLPSGDPDKVRGFSPTLTICDEFSTLPNQDEFYASIFPFITSPFGGEKKLVICGTPLGTQNLFWRLWVEPNDFAKYSIDIYQARSMGLNVDIDLLKKNIPDEDTFNQEYLCRPMDSITNLFTYDLLNTVTYAIPPSQVIARYGGMDIGRTHDLTAIAILAVGIDGRVFLEEVKALHNTEFREQFKEACGIIRALGLKRMCVDSTGIGMQLAEDLQREFGAGMIEAVMFNNTNKTEMLNGLKKAFSDRTCLIPNDPDLLREFQSIKRVTTATGISYQADHNAAGHADRAISVALSHRAYLTDMRSMDFTPMAFE